MAYESDAQPIRIGYLMDFQLMSRPTCSID